MQFVTSKEASKRLGVHPNTLRRWANNNQIDHIKTNAGQRLYNIDCFVGNRSTNTTTIQIEFQENHFLSIVNYAKEKKQDAASILQNWILFTMVSKGILDKNILEDIQNSIS